MSRKTQSNRYVKKNSRRFIDELTGELGYTSRYTLDRFGRMVKPENNDPVPSVEMIPNIEPEKIPEYSSPKPPTIFRSYKNVYDFDSSYLDRLYGPPTGISLAELNPELVVLQLANLQSWEEIDVVWNAEYSIFTNSAWNANINFIDDMLSEVFVFGDRIQKAYRPLPGED